MANFTQRQTETLALGEEFVSTGFVGTGSNDIEIGFDGTSEKLVGLWFHDVTIPQGATIDSATIQFQADEVGTGSPVLDIDCEDIDDAPKVAEEDSNVSNRTLTTSTTSWSPAAWTVPDAGADQLTTDFKSSVQIVVDRGGWASGQDMFVTIAYASGASDPSRVAESFDGVSAGAPEISIDYTAAGGANPKGPLGHPLTGPFGGPI